MKAVDDFNIFNFIPVVPKGVILKRQKNRGFLIGKGIVFLLNASALGILEQCDGKNNVQEVLNNLRNSFVFKENYDPQSEVITFIKKLIDAGVITTKRSIGGAEHVSHC